MSSPATSSDLLALLSEGRTVLLPNARAARTLSAANDAAQRAAGIAAWQPAQALSWQQFTSDLWSDLILDGVESRLLLNSAQEHSLWREIIAVANTDALASSDSLADLAQSAFHLAAAYNTIERLRSTPNTHDSRTFAAWAEAFTRRCTHDQLLSSAQLDEALVKHLHKQALTVPTELHLVGFETWTPSQTTLLEAFRNANCRIIEHDLSATQSDPLQASVIAPSERDELTLAANWIRNFLQAHAAENKSIAVLLPNVSNDRAELEMVFREVLAPELESIHTDLSSTPWEFSTGVPLGLLPIIDAALTLAELANAALPIDRISALLLSPYLGLATDRDLAARFDAAVLRRTHLLTPELDLASLLALATAQANKTIAPSWLRNGHHQLSRDSNFTKPRTFAEWSDALRDLAAAANWPGQRTLTAAEFEATRAWDSTLDLLATLDFTGRRVSYPTFLQTLQRQARTTTFTPPSTNASIQIMSIEEAAGSVFDAVLFLRATDANWPPSPQPNPLLSWPLQRSLNMPGADPAAASALAHKFTANLLRCSSISFFSSAAENTDGQLRPSPILAALDIQCIAPSGLAVAASSSQHIVLDTVIDNAPLPPLPSSAIRGGARVLQLQAACGFRAFAEFRLQAAKLDDITFGLDAPESGQLIHQALRIFWKRLKTQNALRALATDEREQLLRRCIDEAMSRDLQPQSSWDEAYISLQKQRLVNLLEHWLDCELERGPFAVLDSEVKQEIPVGPLTFDLRFDRIDKIEATAESSEGFVLVDYKTGLSGHPKDWAGDRPDDPQLPLYVLPYESDELKGLAFAKVRTGKMEWLGYQSEPGILPSSRVNQVLTLPVVVEEWKQVLHQLAHDFADGKASVDPNHYPQTCRHCAQRLLCRLDPATLLNPLESEEESERDDG
jgi:ATP-dependent helicase/nuclease subunit B